MSASTNENSPLSIVLFGLGVLVLLLLTPFFTIFSLNTLFALSIPINIWTWLSSAWIQFLLFLSTTNVNHISHVTEIEKK